MHAHRYRIYGLHYYHVFVDYSSALSTVHVYTSDTMSVPPYDFPGLFDAPQCFVCSEPENRFQGTSSARLCSLAGLYDNPVPTLFLAHIDCLKIPAQVTRIC
jgi:hypothetical protein